MIVKPRRATILMCSAVVAVFATSALARPAHHRHRVAVATHTEVQPQALEADRDVRYSFNAGQGPAANAMAAETSADMPSRRHRGRYDRTTARALAQSHSNSAFGGTTSNALVTEARRYIGTNPTGRGSLWCGAFMDLILKRTGHAGGGNLAKAYAHYGTRVSGPQVGAIAVMTRRGGGHVGVVSGIDPNGNPIVVSGNHNRTVAESVYPASRVTAYVLPGS
ncbi:MAG TPA: TIGR02594 family protein [Pseudolabrys sp.]|nr:TIGR02594 family protein [Pseudolabrys sp.]